MKKNKMMRAASFLLVAVLLTTSVISGTFAKYVTTATGSDSARVAKWGVTVNPNGELFLTAYEKDDNTFTKADNTVVSSDTWKLVAPGTTHGLTEVQLTGTPEVATRVTYDATLVLGPWSVTSGEYCPIVFTVEGATYGTNDTDATNKYATIAALITAVEEAIEDCKEDYAPNTDLSSVSTDYPSVSWSWPIETGADDEAKAANNLKDTELGNLAASGNHSMIQLTIATTVTQID